MAAFGLKYYAELRSKYKSVLWRVEIAERGYTGTAEEMSFDGDNPLTITWEKRGDEFHVPVKASEATINILCRENFHYLSLFTSNPRQFRVSVLRNRQLYWRPISIPRTSPRRPIRSASRPLTDSICCRAFRSAT